MEDPAKDPESTEVSSSDRTRSGLAAARPDACELLRAHPRVVSLLDSLIPQRRRDESDCAFYLAHHLPTDALLCVLDVLFPADPVAKDSCPAGVSLTSNSFSDSDVELLESAPRRLSDRDAIAPEIRQEIAVAIARCWLAAGLGTVSPEAEARLLEVAMKITGAEVAELRYEASESNAVSGSAPLKETRALALLRRHPHYRAWLAKGARADTIESLRSYQRGHLRSDLFLCIFTLLFPKVVFADDFMEIVVGPKRSVHRQGFDLAGWIDQWPSRSQAEAIANRVIVHTLFYGDAVAESPDPEGGFDDLFDYLAQKMRLCWREQLRVALPGESAEVDVYGEPYEPIVTAYRPDLRLADNDA